MTDQTTHCNLRDAHVLLPQPLYLRDSKGDEVIVMHEGKYGCSVGTLEIRLSQTEKLASVPGK